MGEVHRGSAHIPVIVNALNSQDLKTSARRLTGSVIPVKLRRRQQIQATTPLFWHMMANILMEKDDSGQLSFLDSTTFADVNLRNCAIFATSAAAR
jgi:hypothetical protein